ncbi:glucose-1-phosphate thymidylyltransferase RfbA [Bacillus sp. FJAT-49705]|uniref:Glucose-1-phosphate thymidylyltransferase n=1 Tax=Cytobacillus citreus TaxID=2833586 RepID=A0ABS5NXZ3_9BACI|nr:glucose-1-phosphate thymidylyltransferase RfbA [Cytobacillus citreus]
MKGIIIAGGKGTRLRPLTKMISKSLLPAYDKPMIYYPLSILMQAGINEILIITTPQDKGRFVKLLGDGSQIGISLSYEVEPEPRGIGQAFIIGEKFIRGGPVALILGDNIFYGEGLASLLYRVSERKVGATIFSYEVDAPEQFGVVSISHDGRAISLEEKPSIPKSNHAVTGLYFYDHQVIEIAKNLERSERGELEITDINKVYLNKGELFVEQLDNGFSWMDTGTHLSLIEAANFIEEMEKQKKIKIGCIEEVAFNKGLITKEQLISLAEPLLKTDYGQHLLKIAKTKECFPLKNRKEQGFDSLS